MIEGIKSISLADLTTDEIGLILMMAMDGGDWHTPSISDIRIHTQTDRCVYGYGNISLHSNYHDIEHWFNINSTSIKIWKEEYVKGKANKNIFRPIYNIPDLAKILSQLNTK